jgi:hypothetical protein
MCHRLDAIVDAQQVACLQENQHRGEAERPMALGGLPCQFGCFMGLLIRPLDTPAPVSERPRLSHAP